MAPRRTPRVARVQRVRAVPTCVRGELDDHVDALGRDQWTMPSGMPRLTAWLPPTLHTPAAHARLTGETIG